MITILNDENSYNYNSYLDKAYIDALNIWAADRYGLLENFKEELGSELANYEIRMHASARYGNNQKQNNEHFNSEYSKLNIEIRNLQEINTEKLSRNPTLEPHEYRIDVLNRAVDIIKLEAKRDFIKKYLGK